MTVDLKTLRSHPDHAWRRTCLVADRAKESHTQQLLVQCTGRWCCRSAWERCIRSCIKHRHPMLCSVTDRSAMEGVVETFIWLISLHTGPNVGSRSAGEAGGLMWEAGELMEGSCHGSGRIGEAH